MYNKKENERFTFDLQKAIAKKLKDAAKREGESISCILRKIIREYFNT